MAEKNYDYEEQPQPQKSTNWAAIVLGLILAAVLFLGALYLIQQSSSGEPDVVVGVVKAPVEQQPVEPPVEAPVEAPVEQPDDLTRSESNDLLVRLKGELNNICSSAGLASGVVIFSGYSVVKKRKTEEDSKK